MRIGFLFILLCRAGSAFHYMIIPGMGGSVLLEKQTKTQVWPPSNPFRFHEISKIELECEGKKCKDCDQIIIHQTGDLRSIRLSNYWTSLLTKNSYYDSLVDFLLDKKKRVHALPYDFRKVHKKGYLSTIFDEYKKYIESKSEKTILVCHSLGGLVLYEFLRRMDTYWIEKHIEHVFFICVPFAGAVDSLHSVLTNDVNVSNIPLKLKTLRYFGGFYMAFPTDNKSVIRYNNKLFPVGKDLFQIFGLDKCYDLLGDINFDRKGSLGVGSTFIVADNVLTKSLLCMDNLEKSIMVRGDGLVTNESLLYPFHYWEGDLNLIRISDSDHGRICGHKKTMSSISDYSP